MHRRWDGEILLKNVLRLPDYHRSGQNSVRDDLKISDNALMLEFVRFQLLLLKGKTFKISSMVISDGTAQTIFI